MISRRTLITLLGLLVSGVLLAQPEEPPKPARLRFLFLDESPGSYTLKNASGYRRISSNPYEISAPITPGDLRPFDLFKTLPDTDTGAHRPVKIATITPPVDTPSAVVIVTPRAPSGPDVAPAYKVEVIDTDPADFPPGAIRIINRSPVAMAGQFNDDRIAVAPNETKIVRPALDIRNRVLFKVAIQIQNSDGWELVEDSITVIRPPERMIGILVHSPGGMRHMLTAAEIAEMGPPKPGNFWLTFSDSP